MNERERSGLPRVLTVLSGSDWVIEEWYSLTYFKNISSQGELRGYFPTYYKARENFILRPEDTQKPDHEQPVCRIHKVLVLRNQKTGRGFILKGREPENFVL